jgi:hypothetical protein
MAVFQFHLQSGKQRKVRWVGDGNHIVFGQKFPGKEGSERQCFVVMQEPFLLSPNFGAKSSKVFAHFQAVTINVTLVYGIDCLAY